MTYPGAMPAPASPVAPLGIGEHPPFSFFHFRPQPLSRKDRSIMDRLSDSAAGIEAARKAVLAMADGDEDAALAALNTTASQGEAVWAAAWLLSGIKEAISARVGDDPRRLELALRRAADCAAEDTVLTQVRLIVHEAERNL